MNDALTVEILDKKYGCINKKIENATKQLKECLGFYGIQLPPPLQQPPEKNLENGKMKKPSPQSSVVTIIRKRPKMTLTMADLENIEEDEFKIDVNPVVTPKSSRPKRQCRRYIKYQDE